MGKNGGYRPGAGRKKGTNGQKVLDQRALWAKSIAAQARAVWQEAHRLRQEAGPRPARDDHEAARNFVVKLLTRCAAGIGKGDARAAMHLADRLCGAVRQEIGHELDGPHGGPITVRLVEEEYAARGGQRPPAEEA